MDVCVALHDDGALCAAGSTQRSAHTVYDAHHREDATTPLEVALCPHGVAVGRAARDQIADAIIVDQLLQRAVTGDCIVQGPTGETWQVETLLTFVVQKLLRDARLAAQDVVSKLTIVLPRAFPMQRRSRMRDNLLALGIARLQFVDWPVACLQAAIPSPHPGETALLVDIGCEQVAVTSLSWHAPGWETQFVHTAVADGTRQFEHQMGRAIGIPAPSAGPAPLIVLKPDFRSALAQLLSQRAEVVRMVSLESDRVLEWLLPRTLAQASADAWARKVVESIEQELASAGLAMEQAHQVVIVGHDPLAHLVRKQLTTDHQRYTSVHPRALAALGGLGIPDTRETGGECDVSSCDNVARDVAAGKHQSQLELLLQTPWWD